MSTVERGGGATSYLVRLWREPRGDRAGGGQERVFVRELRSGEERYLSSVEDLTDYLARRQRSAGGESAGDVHGRRLTG